MIEYSLTVRGHAVAVCLLLGCGDNLIGGSVQLAHTHDLDVVAHQDDDLLFMQPDVIEAVRRGTGVTNLYITAGNGQKGTDAANPRYAGLKAAYGDAANDHAWDCGWITVREHPIQHCRLEAENVSLLFLAYPDGGKYGELHHSLLRLWEGSIENATTVADRTTVYSRSELIETVAAIMRTVAPATVRTLDLAASHGYDHSDHMIVGALTGLALARTNLDPELLTYRGYNIASEPVNKLPAVIASVHDVLAHYEACATNCGAACGSPCTKIDASHDTWLARRYAVGFRNRARGQLRSGSQCLTGAGLGACATAPSFSFAHGQLAFGSGCLAIDDSGTPVFATCENDNPAQRFLFDDEDHLWSGLAPETGPLLDYAHMRCVVPKADNTVTTETCGGPDAARWQWAPALVYTPRAQLGFTATGRAVRLGDLDGDGLADLCAITATGLLCAPGRGDGTFAPSVRIDNPAAPLAIDPQSLTIGDLDRDGLPDACGRDSAGVLCALSSAHFSTTRFTSNFSDSDARATTSSSLAIADADGNGTNDLCGIAAAGVLCTAGLAAFDKTELRSSWPAISSAVLPRDLDGDHQTDWCALTDIGPACGLAAETALSTDGVPWGFSMNNVIDTFLAGPDLTDIADIDGDGDGDLCSPIDGAIGCARSNGRGFGPRTTVAVLPDGVTVRALWLGDLDGDGRADACVDLGDQIACAML